MRAKRRITDSEAVKAWRDQFRLNCSPGRKRDIDLTVTDLDLWRDVLKKWGYWKGEKWIKFNPLAIGHQLSEYERLEKKRTLADVTNTKSTNKRTDTRRSEALDHRTVARL